MADATTFAIIGASLAGVRAAAGIREGGFEGRLLMIGEEPHLPYDRPPLSKGVLNRSVGAADTLLMPSSFYEEMGIELLLGQRTVALRAGDGSIELADGRSIRAEKVLLATGGRPRRLDVEGASLKGVHTLRTIEDAMAIESGLRPGARVLVVGAGFVGAEVAATAVGCGCDVTMLEVAALPLGRVLDPAICRHYATQHLERGVRLLTSTGLERIVGEGTVTGVVTSRGELIPADIVVVGVGIIPNTELAAGIGLSISDGVVVNEMGMTSNSSVFAAGDVANYPSVHHGRRVRTEQWKHASDHGYAVGRSMSGTGSAYEAVPWFWSDQFDLHLQMAGAIDTADHVVWRGSIDANDFAAFYLRGGRLVGVVAVNRPKDVRSGMTLIKDRAVVSEEQLADATVDVRRTVLEDPPTSVQ